MELSNEVANDSNAYNSDESLIQLISALRVYQQKSETYITT